MNARSFADRSRDVGYIHAQSARLAHREPAMSNPDGSTTVAAANGRRCRVASASARLEGRGVLQLIGAFLFCPCHLPLTLALAGMLLAGGGRRAAARPSGRGGRSRHARVVRREHGGVHLLRAARRLAVARTP